MTRADAVADAYGLTRAEVARWQPSLIDTFYRAAVNRGWLVPDPTTDRNPT